MPTRHVEHATAPHQRHAPRRRIPGPDEVAPDAAELSARIERMRVDLRYFGDRLARIERQTREAGR